LSIDGLVKRPSIDRKWVKRHGAIFDPVININMIQDIKKDEYQLTEDDRFNIMQIFSEEIIPKLRRMHAKIGTLNCDFAGDQYSHWNLLFESRRNDFVIVGFEYDADSNCFDLGT